MVLIVSVCVQLQQQRRQQQRLRWHLQLRLQQQREQQQLRFTKITSVFEIGSTPYFILCDVHDLRDIKINRLPAVSYPHRFVTLPRYEYYFHAVVCCPEHNQAAIENMRLLLRNCSSGK